jgi:hypothetical protein
MWWNSASSSRVVALFVVRKYNYITHAYRPCSVSKRAWYFPNVNLIRFLIFENCGMSFGVRIFDPSEQHCRNPVEPHMYTSPLAICVIHRTGNTCFTKCVIVSTFDCVYSFESLYAIDIIWFV